MGADYDVPFVNLGWQFLKNERKFLKSLRKVGRSGNFILGEAVSRFESQIASFLRVKHAISCGNGSDAILLALKAHGIGPGDEVVTVSNTFVGTVWPIVALGATPKLVDIDDSGGIDVTQVAEVIGARTKAVIPVHLSGVPVDISKLKQSIPESVAIVEDCAQAFGSQINGDFLGTQGDAGAFSLHPLKNLAVLGDGGMVTTNSDLIADEVRLLRNHGLSGRNHLVRWGINSRLDELQANFAIERLGVFESWAAKISEIAGIYFEGLSGLEPFVASPTLIPGAKVVFHNYVIRAEKRNSLSSFLRSNGVSTAVHYPIPVHRQEIWRQSGFETRDLPLTDNYVGSALSLPIYPGLPKRSAKRVVELIRTFVSSNRQ